MFIPTFNVIGISKWNSLVEVCNGFLLELSDIHIVSHYLGVLCVLVLSLWSIMARLQDHENVPKNDANYMLQDDTKVFGGLKAWEEISFTNPFKKADKFQFI